MFIFQWIKNLFWTDISNLLKDKHMSDINVLPEQTPAATSTTVISNPAFAQPQPVSAAATVTGTMVGTTVATAAIKSPRTFQDKISLYKHFKEVLGDDFAAVETDFINIIGELV